MPHSVSPAGSPSRNDDEMLPDAPDAPTDTSTTNGGVKLEEMFDDDDEEFPASSAQDVKMESSPAPDQPA